MTNLRTIEEIEKEQARLEEEKKEVLKHNKSKLKQEFDEFIKKSGFTKDEAFKILGIKAGKSSTSSSPKAPAIEQGTYVNKDGEEWTSGGRGKRPAWVNEAYAAGSLGELKKK